MAPSSSCVGWSGQGVLLGKVRLIGTEEGDLIGTFDVKQKPGKRIAR
ncbi:MAG: hypothetical protein GYA24_16080 [Candidatus Lokiarchaeota archaeon]|nr:hypothetical protein [Candidatus Lokiarchaeota archaeon]